MIYDTLLAYDEQFNIQPRLATGWAWSSDLRELTLRLRSDVAFHSGRPFTSDDARFNLERVRDPSDGSQWQNYAQLMEVTAPTPDVLVIRYDAPVRSSVDALVLTYMADPQTLDQIASGGPFIGTGAFKFQFLFRRLLQRKLHAQFDRQTIAALPKRACAWFASRICWRRPSAISSPPAMHRQPPAWSRRACSTARRGGRSGGCWNLCRSPYVLCPAWWSPAPGYSTLRGGAHRFPHFLPPSVHPALTATTHFRAPCAPISTLFCR